MQSKYSNDFDNGKNRTLDKLEKGKNKQIHTFKRVKNKDLKHHQYFVASRKRSHHYSMAQYNKLSGTNDNNKKTRKIEKKTKMLNERMEMKWPKLKNERPTKTRPRNND